MPKYPKDRTEAERHIKSLYGWSREHYGLQTRATDQEVMDIAWDQIQFEDRHGMKYKHKHLD